MIVEGFGEKELESEEEEIVVETNVKHAHFLNEDDSYVPKSHYTKSHWARATMETMKTIDDVEEPVVALVDSSFEINIMSKNLYMKGNWPIDMDRGWQVKVANTLLGALYAACPNA